MIILTSTALCSVFAQSMGGAGTNLLFFGALFAIMYFVLIRPQQKQMKAQQTMLAALKKGDEVVTQGGMLGKVFAVTDKIVTLEVASGVRMRVLKSSIQSKTAAPSEPTNSAEDTKKEEQ